MVIPYEVYSDAREKIDSIDFLFDAMEDGRVNDDIFSMCFKLRTNFFSTMDILERTILNFYESIGVEVGDKGYNVDCGQGIVLKYGITFRMDQASFENYFGDYIPVTGKIENFSKGLSEDAEGKLDRTLTQKIFTSIDTHGRVCVLLESQKAVDVVLGRYFVERYGEV